jgi:AmiR/NasT family two-component response regulator
MKRSRIPSFRGLHAQIAHTAGADRTLLQTQLERLGLRVSTVDELPGPPGPDVDVLFFDADRSASRPEDDEGALPCAIPTIALIGSEAPGRLEALLRRQPSAYLMKPVRRTGIYSCLAIAIHQFAVLRQSNRRLQAAEDRVRLRRKVISAVVRLMQREQLSEDAAFQLLQRGAMARRISIEALSLQIISDRQPSAELLSDAAIDRRRAPG